MKALKIIGNNEILVSTLLVLCALDLIHWKFFWFAFVLSELNALIWLMRDGNYSKET